MDEVWKDVVGYEGFYEVSSMGNVRRVGAVANLKPGKLNKGYLGVGLCANKTKKSVTVHRLVAIAFLGMPKNNLEVNHINGVKNDNRLENLEWVTSRENHLHAVSAGLSNFEYCTGEKSVVSKLKEKDIAIIRNMKANNKTYREISEKFNVSKGAIQGVIDFKTWKHTLRKPEVSK